MKNLKEKFFNLNIFFTFLMVFLFICQIYVSNSITSKKYSIELKRSEFNKISSSYYISALESGYEPDMASLIRFAQERGMVEARTGQTYSQANGVALTR